MEKTLNKVTSNIRKAEENGRKALRSVAKEMYNAKLLIDSGVNTLIEDGDVVTQYKNITEYGKEVFNYSPANTSKLTSVAERFLIGENENHFIEYNVSQLVEMLPLNTVDIESLIINGDITPKMSCVDIRNIVKGTLTIETTDSTDSEDDVDSTDSEDDVDSTDSEDDVDSTDNTTDIINIIIDNINVLKTILKEEESNGIELLKAIEAGIKKINK